jgi:hypothetical protein
LPNEMDDAPPGACTTRVVGRSVMQLPEFCELPLAATPHARAHVVSQCIAWVVRIVLSRSSHARVCPAAR